MLSEESETNVALWMLFITDVLPSAVQPWNPSENRERSTGWLIRSLLWCCLLKTPTWLSLNRHLSVCPCLSFSSEFGLHYYSHHSPDTAVTDSDRRLLLQSDCKTVRIRNKATTEDKVLPQIKISMACHLKPLKHSILGKRIKTHGLLLYLE